MVYRPFQMLLLLFLTTGIFAQDAPNVSNSGQASPNTAAGSRASLTNVNIFTGIPSVSIPIYQFSGKGMNLAVAAQYIGGGVKDGSKPSFIGLGWYLDAGGVITRTVRGSPDDATTSGFMYAGAIPNDFRSNANKYYYDTVDAQPDEFQFNFNGKSGKLYIGKNHQIVVVPQSMLNIQYTTNGSGMINSFKIKTESGVKYIFSALESSSQTPYPDDAYYRSAFSGNTYYSAWYLTQIISPFNTDTIKFSYSSKTLDTKFSYPQVSFIRAQNHSQAALYTSSGTNHSTITKLSSITLPDKTSISFIYSSFKKYDDSDYALERIKIGDTIFRKGYLFNYSTSFTGTILKYDKVHDKDVPASVSYNTNLLLQSIIPYSSKMQNKGYSFSYYTPYPVYNDAEYADSVLNAYDHWGYFNGWQTETNAIPYIPGINLSGANRAPSSSRAIENALENVMLPDGGITHYEYELNTVAPYTLDTQRIAVKTADASSSNTVSFSQVFSSWHQLIFSFPNTFSNLGTPPLTGTCNLVCNIKSTDGSILYASTSFSMYDLYYHGIQTFQFNVPNGTYKMETSISGGGSETAPIFFSISWTNRLSGTTDIKTGGIRVSRIVKRTAAGSSDSLVEDYVYTSVNGKSSGFLGDIPQYFYWFQKTITTPHSDSTFYAVNSDPVNSVNFAQGSPVGYSRVTVFNGKQTKNRGKTVYEFTNLSDINTNYYYAVFPYAPQDIYEWGLGLPKRISIYDSADNLVQKTTNTYTFHPTAYNTTNFKGVKLGCRITTYATDPGTNPSTQRTNTYIGQFYYPTTGWASLDNTTDTLYHTDGSVQTSFKTFTYDSYYNVSKITAPYNKTEGLNLEARIYYPYNYSLSSGAIKTLKDSSIISTAVSTERWITGDGNPRVLSASITDFKQLSQGYIVPQDIYSFQSNKPVIQSVIGSFNSSQLVRNATYFIKQQSFPTYDNEGNLVQSTNVLSGQANTVIMDYNKNYPVAKISNAGNANVAYTSFESDGTGNWTISGSARNKTSSVTGKQSYSLGSGNVTKTGLSASLPYIITMWVKFSSGSMNVNGAATTNIASHQGWGLYTTTVSGVTSVTISGTGLIDELRLMPEDANMITYTYEPNVGVTSTCDANNTILYSEYDNFSRIKLLRDIDGNILKRYDYSDSIFSSLISNQPDWVGVGTACKSGQTGLYDSIYMDMNAYSDSYMDTIHVQKGYNYCLCTTNPQYKMVNGTCELGTKVLTQSVRVKVLIFGQNPYWEWHCTYHYHWSDGADSQDFTDVYPDQSTSPCGDVGG